VDETQTRLIQYYSQSGLKKPRSGSGVFYFAPWQYSFGLFATKLPTTSMITIAYPKYFSRCAVQRMYKTPSLLTEC
jgi:hypothetical protein